MNNWTKITVGVYEISLPKNRFGYVRARTMGINPSDHYGYNNTDCLKTSVLLYMSDGVFVFKSMEWLEQNILNNN